jgi:transposase
VFYRKSKNRSGSISVQIIKKVKGKNKLVKTIGSACDAQGIELLTIQAREYIERTTGKASLFFEHEDLIIENFVNNLRQDQLCVIGPQLVLEKIYNIIGYDKIDTSIYFKHLVICRIAYPGSKLRTIEYLSRHHNIEVSVHTIYRYMDKIEADVKPLVEQITFEHTRSILKGRLGVVFYDMTTLYFETETEDDIRKIGYSKDGKHQHPQIMIGLLVSEHGYPVGYEIFEGNTSETKTLIPLIESLKDKFNIDKPVIIADSALLSKSNLEQLNVKGYEYVLGGRIKNENQSLKQLILTTEIKENQPIELAHPYGKLIVSYSSKRAKKDLFNRKRGLKRLEAKVKTGKLTKEAINNRGYNKYLVLEGQTTINIDYTKFEKDSVWDGLKGYVTNTSLESPAVISAYNNLWQVEKAFRMSKSDLRFRPIYHRLKSRIESHILICFTAYAVYKELERRLIEKKCTFSVEKAINHLKQIQQLTYRLPKSKQIKTRIISPNEKQNFLLNLFEK